MYIFFIGRCARHIFQIYMQNVDGMQTGAAVAHFLNCFILLGSTSQGSSFAHAESVQQQDSLLQQKKNKKSKRKQSLFGTSGWNRARNTDRKSSDWKKLTQKILWCELIDDALQHYVCKLPTENCDQFVEWSGAQKVSLLRRFCTIVGVQLQLKVCFLLFFFGF